MSKKIKRLYICITIAIFILLAFLVCPPLMFWNKPVMWGGFPASEVFLFVDCVLQCLVMIIGLAIENKINKEEKEMRKRGEIIEY